MIRELIFVGCMVVLGGCAAEEIAIQPETVAPTTTEADEVREVPEGNYRIIYDSQRLLAVNTHRAQAYPLGVMEQNYMPPGMDLDTFQLTQDRERIVWYHPAHGFLAYNLKEKRTEVLTQPSAWFNTDSYFQLVNDEIYYMDGNGEELVRYNIVTSDVTRQRLPKPYGTQFIISPDRKLGLHIPGYGISADYPEYLIINWETQETYEFRTESELADKSEVTWRSDSKGVFAIDRGNVIAYYPVGGSEEKMTFVSEEPGIRYVRIENIGETLFAEDRNGDWYMFDSFDATLHGVIPQQIMTPNVSGTIYPIDNETMLIDEIIKDFDIQFHRLWVSDTKGAKKMVYPRFFESLLVE